MHAHGKGSGKSSSADRGEEFASKGGIIPEGPEHAPGHHAAAMGADAARRHAAMLGVEHHGNTARMKRARDRHGDVTGQALLDLQAAGAGIDQPGQLRDADHAAPGR
jgi:hypothetical protein